MLKPLNHPLICVVGPTASGKTELAQLLAENLSAAVMSADSMQIYSGMDIGTGKIPVSERTVDYFGLDLVDPGETYSAALFQEYGRSIIEKKDMDSERVVLCGGTGFYLRAIIDDFQFPKGEQTSNSVRQHYQQLLEEQGSHVLWNTLYSLDVESALVIPENDTKRVIRALELYEDGLSYAEQKEKFSSIGPYYPSVQIGLSVEPDVLNERINRRVDCMLEQGLIQEVSSLMKQGYRSAITANQAIGYKELVNFLEGRMSLDESVSQIKLATRRYAKRQRSWFRKDERINWIDATDVSIEEQLNSSLQIVGNAL